MNREFFHEVLTQLACRIPTLLVCVVGFSLSAACWRRSPRACFLAIIAAVLVVAAILGNVGLSQYLLTVEPPFDDEATLLDAVTLVTDIVQAIAIGLLFAANLVGRSSKYEPHSDFAVD